METSTNQIKKNSKNHLLVVFIALIFSPLLSLFYLLFLPITIPVTLIVYHYYKVQIKKHLSELYQDANLIVQNGLKDYVVPTYNAIKTKINEIIAFLLIPFEKLKEQAFDCFNKTKTYLLSFECINSSLGQLKSIWAIICDLKNIVYVVLNESLLKVQNNIFVKFVVSIYSNYISPKLQTVQQLYTYLKSKLGIDLALNNIQEKFLKVPQDKIQIIGYAILNESGKTIQDLSPAQEIDRYRIQLHQYAITQFWKIKNFKDKQILELECGDAVGLQYIASAYQPQRCLGVDSSQQQIEKNGKIYNEQNNLKFEVRDPLEIGTLCPPNTFDIIIGLELKKKEAFSNIDFKSYIKIASTLLKDDGYFIIGDYETQEEIQKLQDEISANGLVIAEKNDFTVGITQAMKLQIRKIKQSVRQNGNLIAKFLSNRLKPNENLLQQLKDRQQIYMVYILKKAQL
ncbi:unnamed protein product [Paramecium sonneborni]|uniref:Methyltransferase domain-containing protein n=1 Tax=Paramecium sonneborni TaxID=65129 RepID=A0A8S1PYL6_9CILI|nr:unnamed protein product [Paramecium sonneborni]